MAFVSQYTKPRLTLRNAATFLEDNNAFVYAVGHTGAHAVVIKTSVDGATVWCRALRLGPADLRFYDVAQLRHSAGTRYAISAYNGQNFYVVCIDADGQEVWVREIPTRDADAHAFLIANAKQEGFYFVYSDKNEADTTLSPMILQFDAGGTPDSSSTLSEFIPMASPSRAASSLTPPSAAPWCSIRASRAMKRQPSRE
jgi:hypothetical protein